MDEQTKEEVGIRLVEIAQRYAGNDDVRFLLEVIERQAAAIEKMA